MSFGFSVGDFLAVIELVKKVRKDFVGAPDQFQQISVELRFLDHAIRDVEILLSEQVCSQTQEKSLCEITSNCRHILNDTQKTLNNYSTLKSQGGGIRERANRVWERLQLEPDDIRELRSRITLNITYLNSFREGFTRDNVVKLVKLQDQLVERQEQQQILDWLTPIDYGVQQYDIGRRRQAGTGQWLLQSPEYQQWLTKEKEILFCPGIPGAGKTILTSTVVDNLFELYRTDQSVGICYIFFNFHRNSEQKLDDLIASLLKQLGQTRPDLFGSVKLLYDGHKERRTRPSLDELCRALHSVVTGHSRVFVVIDALDECQTFDNCRSRFISELLNLWSRPGVSIFATSRFIPDIMARFEDAMVKEIRASDHDIVKFLDGNLPYLPGLVSRDITLQAEIKQAIVQCVDGMFLLAQLHLDSLKGKPSRKAVRTALSGLPKGSDAYDTAYNNAMDRIERQHSDQKDLALRALSWITSAKRPLTTVELQHALGVELNETDLDRDNIPDLEDIVSACCGLITIDEQSDIIRLVHYTTQEYFQRTRTKWFPLAESEIAETCVAYLSYNTFESGRCKTDPEFEERLSSYPLYDYASHYWGSHARSTLDYEYCFKFLTMTSKVNASSQALLAVKSSSCYRALAYSQLMPMELSGLHLAASFGLYEAVRSLVDSHAIEARDSFGKTPLSYAIDHGHVDVVELLLENNAEINSKVEGRTPLSFAAANGHESIVRLLLENNADIDLETEGMTPLSFAVMNGHKSIVRLLLENNADINSETWGPTPLSFAVVNGHESIVRLLLENNADIDSEIWGMTPLSLAVECGHESIVRLLLENNARTNSNAEGMAPLYFAMVNKHESIMRLLLENNAETDFYVLPGGTPLAFAVENGFESMVRLLLENSAEIASNVDNGAPLLRAAGGGHEAMVRLLLEKGANVNSKTDTGGDAGLTPLSHAAQRGHEAVVRLLLEKGAEIDPRIMRARNRGRTPLSFAAGNGFEGIVRLLLEKGAEVDSEDQYGQTPLFHAVEAGHETVVRLLLEKGASIESLDTDGNTLLSYAIENGREGVVRLLQEKAAG